MEKLTHDERQELLAEIAEARAQDPPDLERAARAALKYLEDTYSYSVRTRPRFRMVSPFPYLGTLSNVVRAFDDGIDTRMLNLERLNNALDAVDGGVASKAESVAEVFSKYLHEHHGSKCLDNMEECRSVARGALIFFVEESVAGLIRFINRKTDPAYLYCAVLEAADEYGRDVREWYRNKREELDD